MNNSLTHFAVYTDDVERAKSFYCGVFGWKGTAYGYDDFIQLTADTSHSSNVIGALQSRNFSPIPERVIGFECTIRVEDLDDVVSRVLQNGGQVVLQRTVIPHVGYIAKFLDTEGNIFCAIQYDHAAR